MARIKVTAYLETDDVDSEHLDLDHKTGLSERGYLYYNSTLGLDDMEFVLEK